VFNANRFLKALMASASIAALGVLSAGGGPVAAASAPSTLTVALPPQTSLNYYPPLASDAYCYGWNIGGWFGVDSYLLLLWYGNSGQVDWSQSVASGITVNSADDVYTIHLNPKWHWSNGQQVSASDLYYDIQLVLAASAPTAPWGYCGAGSGGVPNDFKSVKILNSETVQITTTKPVNPGWFEGVGLQQFVPIPKSVWDKYSNMTKELRWIESIENDPTNPVYQVVDGPYRFSSAVPNERWVFTANPEFSGLPKPTFQRVVYEYEASTASAFLAVKEGQVDVASAPMAYATALKKLKTYQVVAPHLYGIQWLALNYKANALDVGSLFKNLYIRQAMQMGIDEAAIVKVWGGDAVPVYGIVPSLPHNIYYDYALKDPYPYDPAKGKALLEAHGWHMVDGVMEKDGQRLAFPLWATSSNSGTIGQDEMQVIAAGWAQEGIQVTINQQTALATAGQKWAVEGPLLWIFPPYPSGDGPFTSTGGPDQAFGGYDSKEMDQLIAATEEPGTVAQTRARFDAYETYAAQQLPDLWVPVVNAAFIYVVSDKVTGFLQNYNGIMAETPFQWLR
jgi:peptide/nickel transport system substrate-binding protein